MKQRLIEPSIENWLASKEPTHLRLAEETLERMGPQAVDALLQMAEREEKKWYRERMVAFFLFIFPSQIPVHLLRYFNPTFLSFLIITLVPVPWMLFVCWQLPKRSKLPHIARRLARYDDIRSIGPLAAGLMVGADEHTKTLVTPVLTRLLRRVTPADMANLNARQHYHLKLLAESRKCTNRCPELVIALLNAFEIIWDKESLKTVRCLAKRKPKTADEQMVQRAAQACLRRLQERLTNPVL